MYVGLGVVMAATLLLVTWWARTFARIVREREPTFWFNFVVGAVVLVAALGLLSARETPNETERGVEQARQAGAGRFDLLLVVDPGDEVGRRLIRAADGAMDEGRAAELLASSPAGGTYDVAIGLAVPRAPGDDGPLWTLVEPPTGDRGEIVAAIAALRPREEGPAPRSYGRLLTDTLLENRAHWRASSQLGVAFMLERLPTLAELDGDAGESEPDLRDCPAESAVDPPAKPTEPVPWAETIAMHCRRRNAYREWEAQGRPKPEQRRPVAVHTLTRRFGEERATPWRRWTRALCGTFHTPEDRADPVVFGADVLRAAVDLHTGRPVGDLAETALRFRPHLYFDATERFLPVDADWLLRNPPPSGTHQVCDHNGARDNCAEITDSSSLVGSLDEYIDFAGGVRLGNDLKAREREPEPHVRARPPDRQPPRPRLLVVPRVQRLTVAGAGELPAGPQPEGAELPRPRG